MHDPLEASQCPMNCSSTHADLGNLQHELASQKVNVSGSELVKIQNFCYSLNMLGIPFFDVENLDYL